MFILRVKKSIEEKDKNRKLFSIFVIILHLQHTYYKNYCNIISLLGGNYE